MTSEEISDDEAMAMVKQAQSLFDGKPLHTQGAVLVELMTSYLCAHEHPADRAAQSELRRHVFMQWCELVAEFMGAYEAEEAEEPAPTVH